MFLDASAIAAVLLREDDAGPMLKAMEAARGKLRFSPVARLEVVLALVRGRVQARGQGPATGEDFDKATALVDELLSELEAHEVHITTGIGRDAIKALSTYGKVVGHPAQLNMGDAFAYACAKAYHIPLLYKGEDFKRTDIA